AQPYRELGPAPPHPIQLGLRGAPKIRHLNALPGLLGRQPFLTLPGALARFECFPAGFGERRDGRSTRDPFARQGGEPARQLTGHWSLERVAWPLAPRLLPQQLCEPSRNRLIKEPGLAR